MRRLRVPGGCRSRECCWWKFLVTVVVLETVPRLLFPPGTGSKAAWPSWQRSASLYLKRSEMLCVWVAWSHDAGVCFSAHRPTLSSCFNAVVQRVRSAKKMLKLW